MICSYLIFPFPIVIIHFCCLEKKVDLFLVMGVSVNVQEHRYSETTIHIHSHSNVCYCYGLLSAGRSRRCRGPSAVSGRLVGTAVLVAGSPRQPIWDRPSPRAGPRRRVLTPLMCVNL